MRGSKYSNERMSKNIFLELVSQNSKIISLINSRDFINWDVDYKYVTMIYNEFINTDLFKHSYFIR